MQNFTNHTRFVPKFFVSVALCLLLNLPMAWGANIKDSISYKLALFQIRTLNPLDNTTEPQQALISEFTWILESLKARCINPETALADTIIQTWQIIKTQGSKMSILDVARELTLQARNTVLFGPSKVNFRMTSNYWLKQFLSKNRKR